MSGQIVTSEVFIAQAQTIEQTLFTTQVPQALNKTNDVSSELGRKF